MKAQRLDKFQGDACAALNPGLNEFSVLDKPTTAGTVPLRVTQHAAAVLLRHCRQRVVGRQRTPARIDDAPLGLFRTVGHHAEVEVPEEGRTDPTPVSHHLVGLYRPLGLFAEVVVVGILVVVGSVRRPRPSQIRSER